MGYQYDPKADLLFHYPNQDGQGYLVPLSVLEGCQPVAVVFSASQAADIEWTEADEQPLIMSIKIVPDSSASALADKIARARGKKKEEIIIARKAQFVSDTPIPPHPVMANPNHTGIM